MLSSYFLSVILALVFTIGYGSPVELDSADTHDSIPALDHEADGGIERRASSSTSGKIEYYTTTYRKITCATSGHTSGQCSTLTAVLTVPEATVTATDTVSVTAPAITGVTGAGTLAPSGFAIIGTAPVSSKSRTVPSTTALTPTGVTTLPDGDVLPLYTVDCASFGNTVQTWTTTAMFGGPAVVECATSTTLPSVSSSSSPTVDCAMLNGSKQYRTTSYANEAMLVMECAETNHPTPIPISGGYVPVLYTSTFVPRASVTITCPKHGAVTECWSDYTSYLHAESTGGAAALPFSITKTLPPSAYFTATCPVDVTDVEACLTNWYTWGAATPAPASTASATAISSTRTTVPSAPTRLDQYQHANKIGYNLPQMPRETKPSVPSLLDPTKTSFITSVTNKPRDSACDEIPIIIGMGLCTLIR
ncbi:hypothetical protein LTR36_000383 [Oleoguttula mirabilis]|uniref:Uncharacterized protein n=1 Tax=Oleoguttula mirabilis TaxID=1507867 RepID=A0AAV9JYD3_9PEZI|nr:hypothetical protein LTR36_000383 [Oleoguttula mirabilis]